MIKTKWVIIVWTSVRMNEKECRHNEKCLPHECVDEFDLDEKNEKCE